MFEPCRVASEEDEVNGTKNYEKVIERVGRIWQKYPSISKYYVIDYIAENPKNMADIQWRIAMPENVVKQSGIYFLRTNFTDCCIWRLPPAVLCCHSDCQSGSDWLAGVVGCRAVVCHLLVMVRHPSVIVRLSVTGGRE